MAFLGCKHFRLSITVPYTFWVDDTNKSDNITDKNLGYQYFAYSNFLTMGKEIPFSLS